MNNSDFKVGDTIVIDKEICQERYKELGLSLSIDFAKNWGETFRIKRFGYLSLSIILDTQPETGGWPPSVLRKKLPEKLKVKDLLKQMEG